MVNLLLYKNLPSEKTNIYQLGLARLLLIAKECADIRYALGMIRYECQHGIADTEPEEYDSMVGLDGFPLTESRPYDVYAEMGYYLRPDDTPHGLGLDLSPALLEVVGGLLVSKATLKTYSE